MTDNNVATTRRKAQPTSTPVHGRDDRSAQACPVDRTRLRFGVPVGWAAFVPICLACTVPMFLVPFMALGLTFGLVFGLHLIAVAAAPLMFWLLWRHFRRHHDRLVVWVGGVGALALLIHLPLHFVPGEGGPLMFTLSDQLGVGLLLVAALLDWRAMRRWTSRQRAVAAIA